MKEETIMKWTELDRVKAAIKELNEQKVWLMEYIASITDLQDLNKIDIECKGYEIPNWFNRKYKDLPVEHKIKYVWD